MRERDVVGPWQRPARHAVYRNAYIEVFHDGVVRPDGELGLYGVVHTRFLAIGVVAIDDHRRVVLVGQHGDVRSRASVALLRRGSRPSTRHRWASPLRQR
jgi:hypothetical protein